jgi:hypothetical protein
MDEQNCTVLPATDVAVKFENSSEKAKKGYNLMLPD